MKFTRMDSATTRPSDGSATTPDVPIRTHTLAFDRWTEGERFAGAEIPLGRLGGATRIGVNVVELAPGKQSCPLHFHVLEEEHFYVLDGRCVLRSGTDRHEMGPGDYVCFPAGTGVAHAFENPFPQPCRMLAIGSRDEAEIAVYPESGKAKLRALDVIVPLPKEGLDYWAGERTSEPLPDQLALQRAQAEARAAEKAAQDQAVEDELAEMKKRLGLP